MGYGRFDCIKRINILYSTIPEAVIVTGFEVWPPVLPTDSIVLTTSIPSTTLPNTTCLPSSYIRINNNKNGM